MLVKLIYIHEFKNTYFEISNSNNYAIIYIFIKFQLKLIINRFIR